MARPRNVLLVTLDQFRGDCLSCAGHPLVRTPNLDALAAGGTRLARHYSQAAPCAPGRAALYTGMYQMNNRVVANGSPLDARFDNIALAARRAGYAPALFGYTDQAVDPREVERTRRSAARVATRACSPGSTPSSISPAGTSRSCRGSTSRGHDVSPGLGRLLVHRARATGARQRVRVPHRHRRRVARSPGRAVVRPPQLPAAPPAVLGGGRVGDARTTPPTSRCRSRRPRTAIRSTSSRSRHPDAAAPMEESRIRRIRAQYYGMISEVDSQLGRVWQTLRDLGAWDDTLIVVTADHGEQLGDHGLIQKLGYWESSYHIVGIVRDPGRRRPVTARSSTASRRTSTSCRRSARRSASTCRCSATGCR